ncbi:MAG TPA: NTP transferase domain-containing protein [Candidatus Diapherotrites archaeon]|uniref:glucose-1-phosphate thymidylyltransferase n=2 Tax=Candidatus Iainarchaeum sp. TaxID=3101447 RepID=A0A7J4JVY4_9ARCH|nr:NTP transferase domain-containing protein [Candidatus Diapherotrites archaeon]
MKGIILAGGLGTRLGLLTKITNKHLLPVYDKPMIFYPLKTMLDAGIKDIMVVIDPQSAGDFLILIGSGAKYGANISYRVQDEIQGLGIAAALRLAEGFCCGDKLAVVLGDNVFEDSFKETVGWFEKQERGACVFLKKVPDPERFGVAELKGDSVVSIEEKPKSPKSDFAVTGFYLYDENVFEIIRALKPSARGELEITDVNNAYLKSGSLKARVLEGFWSDAGTFDSLHNASTFLRQKKA